MVKSCSAYNCQQRHEPGISFHKFPKEPLRLKKWLIAMKREKWKPSASSVLCSRHFQDVCYDISPWASRKDLKKDAVPSIFEFPEHLQKCTKSRPAPKKRSLPKKCSSVEIDDTESGTEYTGTSTMFIDCGVAFTDINTNIFEEPEVPKKRCRYLGDFDFNNPRQYSQEELIQFVNKAKLELDKRSRNIKVLKQKIRRQENKIKSLNSLLHYLQDKDLTTSEAAS